MAAANLVRSAFNGLLKKATTYKAPVVCRLSTVALQQKYHTVKTIARTYNIQQIQNGVRHFRLLYLHLLITVRFILQLICKITN